MNNFKPIDFKTKSKILDDFEEYIKDRTKYHLGYPYNLDFEYQDLSRFFKYSITSKDGLNLYRIDYQKIYWLI